MPEQHRPLSIAESRILRLVRELYGSRNTAQRVIFTDSGDAVIWAEEDDGSIPIVVNLTNVARFAEMDHLSDEQTTEQWLRVPGAR